jgi:hypothetical protein
MKFKEIKTSEIVFFKEPTGTGSVVNVPGKGFYFMPAKKGLRLEGEKKPIVHGESFVFLNYEVLNYSPGKRNIKIQMSRIQDNTIFSIEEHFFKTYFGAV